MANPFKIGDIVRSADGKRFTGKVKYIACNLATAAGGRGCDKKFCNHQNKDIVWVIWPGDKNIFSYHHTELLLDKDGSDTKPEPKTTDDAERTQKVEAIKKVIETKENADFFKFYNGFAKMKKDKFGRLYVQEKEEVQPPEIKDDELNFAAYNGFAPGAPWRKEKLKSVEKQSDTAA